MGQKRSEAPQKPHPQDVSNRMKSGSSTGATLFRVWLYLTWFREHTVNSLNPRVSAEIISDTASEEVTPAGTKKRLIKNPKRKKLAIGVYRVL